MRWMLRIAAVIAALAVGVVGTLLVVGENRRPVRHRAAAPVTADPGAAVTAPLPPVPTTDANGSPAARYLAGPGSLVLTFRALSAPLVGLETTADSDARLAVCRRVAGDLNAQVDPGKLLTAAQAIPDPLLSELAVNDRSARSNALVACGKRDRAATDDALSAVDAIDVLFTRRMKQANP